jgi:hypothetical protein
MQVVSFNRVFLICAAIAGNPGTVAVIDAQEGKPHSGWERSANELEKSRRDLTRKLIDVAEDKKREEPERWEAVVAISKLGTRQGLEYLIDHLDLKLWSGRLNGGESSFGEDRVCYWALKNLNDGWDGDGRNWNVAQVILRALGKERTESEVWQYAYLLRHSLGRLRFSDDKYSPNLRALALVEAELASESAKVAGWDDPKPRATRIKNLTAIRDLLKKEGN